MSPPASGISAAAPSVGGGEVEYDLNPTAHSGSRAIALQNSAISLAK